MLLATAKASHSACEFGDCRDACTQIAVWRYQVLRKQGHAAQQEQTECVQ